MKIQFDKSKTALTATTIIAGITVSMLSGFFENPAKKSMIGATAFGYPWPWRHEIIQATTQNIYKLDNLVADIAFWAIIFFIFFTLLEKFLFSRSNSLLNNKKFVLAMGVLPLLAIMMGLIHEVGHAVLGTAIGGTLSYMQIAYFVIFPKLAIASQFQLGSVIVTGLSTPAQHGLFLLAGSLTTNLVAWIIGILINTKKFNYRTELTFKIVGYLALLDLPFYTIFPTLGLRHWIILGATQPEPLIGAREIGISDPIFYTSVIIITLVLILIYNKSLRHILLQKLKTAFDLNKIQP